MAPDGAGVSVARLDPGGALGPVQALGWDGFAGRVRELESEQPRWVWADTTAVYPKLLRAGVRVRRARDLRQCHAILSRSRYLTDRLGSADDRRWGPDTVDLDQAEPSLLDLPADGGRFAVDEVAREFGQQQEAIAASPYAGRLRLLLAAESAGALLAAELTHVGLPFDVKAHDAMLTALLGSRPLSGGRPAKLEELVGRIRVALSAPGLNPDSAPELLRALHAQGLPVETTRKGELSRLDHPVIEPLLEYKRLARLLSANGWAWMGTWVQEGRFRPDYVPSGVVTGRWATRGGGALQLPKQVRTAVVADVGWRLVVADAAQLEPRVLAAVAADEAMARASRAGDLYQALVDDGVVDTRAHAKVAMLGALYGATSGEAGRLMPRLLRTYPAATGWVESAARAGERGEVVTTWLGRSSPPPPELVAGAAAVGPLSGGGPGRPASGADPGARVGPVHPELRRPGHRRRVGTVLAGRPAPAPCSAGAGARPSAAADLLPARRGHRGNSDRAHRPGGRCGPDSGPPSRTAAVRDVPGRVRPGRLLRHELRRRQLTPSHTLRPTIALRDRCSRRGRVGL